MTSRRNQSPYAKSARFCLRDHPKVGQIARKPQANPLSFLFEEARPDKAAHDYQVVTVDITGRTAEAEVLLLSAI